MSTFIESEALISAQDTSFPFVSTAVPQNTDDLVQVFPAGTYLRIEAIANSLTIVASSGAPYAYDAKVYFKRSGSGEEYIIKGSGTWFGLEDLPANLTVMPLDEIRIFTGATTATYTFAGNNRTLGLKYDLF